MARKAANPPARPSKPGAATRALAPFVPLALAMVAGNAIPTAPTHPPLIHAPSPLLKTGQPVAWWFVFKFNAASLPGCGDDAQRACPFGGTVQPYKKFSQQFAFASSDNGQLQQGGGCVGDTTADPVGATFSEIYNGGYFYVIWNDQFYGDPISTEAAPAGHSKGALAWDSDGNGVVLQVTTPSWPAAGNPDNPRKSDGNTLGCVKDNDVLVSQHFFALRLTHDDVVQVLKALANASVVTDSGVAQIVNNGGPSDVQALVGTLGNHSTSAVATKVTLSSHVQLISKPSRLHVPPWQMVSSLLDGASLRVASWWARPEIPSTTAATAIGCWDSSLTKPGAVEIATSGTWQGQTIGLEGEPEPNGNHAKIGVSTGGTHSYAIFGDMNQQGAISGKCESSQNGRGGLFYVLEDSTLATSVAGLVKGESAPP